MAKTAGLRTEILITLTLLLGAALLLGGVMMLRLTEQSLLQERVQQLDSMSHILAQSLMIQDTDTKDHFSPTLNRTLLNQLSDNVNCDGWWIYDQKLDLVAAYSAGQNSPFSVARRQQVKLFGELQRTINFPTLLNIFGESNTAAHFAVPLIDKNRFSGLLELHYSLDDIRLNLLESQRIVIIYVLLYGVVLVLIGYYLLQRNIINPARNLLKATEDVGLGHLDTRLPLAGPAEIAQLAVAYNQMVEALQASRSETEGYISSLETTNRELQQARDELIRSEKMASVGQLAAGLAHEVGNPLSALIGYLEFLKQKVESTADQDIVKRSLVETTRIDFLVRELLDFSRPADSSQTEEIESVAELKSGVQLLFNQGSIGNLQIIDELPESLSMVKVNRHKLQQVFINLLLNAVQACDQHGKITLTAGEDGSSVWVGIRDDGCGIAANDLNKIFDPFFTTKEPGEGTGLGLAICHRIVEEAGGTIEVESVPGVGSFFKLVFQKKLQV